MLYRLENEYDYIAVKHVATDREIGYAFLDSSVAADGTMVDVCTIYDNRHVRLERVPSTVIALPLRCAAISLAVRQEDSGFPDLQGATWNEHPDRVERRLGTLLADAAIAFSRGVCEAIGEGLTAKTRDEFAAALGELSSIWWVSRVGCIDAVKSRATEQPYFANPQPSGPRLTFSGAAQVYGMRELRDRRPALTDAERQKALSWVLQWLSDLLSNELEDQMRDEAERKLKRPTQGDMNFFNMTMEWRRRQGEYLERWERGSAVTQ
jgi:hypothetical protein